MRIRWALLLTLFLGGCTEALLGEHPSLDNAALFDRFWTEIDQSYAGFPVRAEVDWQALRDVYRPRALAAQDDRALFNTLCAMAAQLQDGHINVVAPFATCGYDAWFRRYPRNFYPDFVRERYLAGEYLVTGGGRITWGVIITPDTLKVGYMHIADFRGTDWVEQIDEVLDKFEGVRGVVVDVRHNGGGATASSEAVAGRFADMRRLFAYVRYRNGPAHMDLTEPTARYIEPTGRVRYGGPVAVLTNRSCFSACENFTMAMQTLPTVTVVGDTTGGGLGNPIYRELPNGWSYRLPVWLQTDAQGNAIERRGLAPDVARGITDDDAFYQRDPILETALRVVVDQSSDFGQ